MRILRILKFANSNRINKGQNKIIQTLLYINTIGLVHVVVTFLASDIHRSP